MEEALRDKLGLKVFGDASKSPSNDLLRIHESLSIKFPKELDDMLLEYKGAVEFKRGMQFKTNGKCSLADADGYIGISLFYGLNDNDFGILNVNRMYDDQIPDFLVIIAESDGGNQVGIEKTTGKILFWNHEGTPGVDELFNIAPSFVDFLEKLEIDPDDEIKPDEIEDYECDF